MRGIGSDPTSQVLMMLDGKPQFAGIYSHPVADNYDAVDSAGWHRSKPGHGMDRQGKPQQGLPQPVIQGALPLQDGEPGPVAGEDDELRSLHPLLIAALLHGCLRSMTDVSLRGNRIVISY